MDMEAEKKGAVKSVKQPLDAELNNSGRKAVRCATDVYLSATATGGQGKTLTAQVIAYALGKIGLAPVLVSADKVSPLPDGSERSKFGSIVSGVIDLGPGPEIDDVQSMAYWDALAEVVGNPPAVVDVGANVIDGILKWARRSKVSSFLGGIDVNLVVPVTAQITPLRDAHSLITSVRAQENSRGMKFRRIVVVLNGRDGPVMESPDCASIIDDMRTSLGVVTAVMDNGPKMISFLEMKSRPLDWVGTVDHERIKDELAFKTRIAAHREREDFLEWLEATVKSFAAAGIA